jgi:hypothetical protein
VPLARTGSSPSRQREKPNHNEQCAAATTSRSRQAPPIHRNWQTQLEARLVESNVCRNKGLRTQDSWRGQSTAMKRLRKGVSRACPFYAAGTVLNGTQFGLCVLSKTWARGTSQSASSDSSCSTFCRTRWIAGDSVGGGAAERRWST